MLARLGDRLLRRAAGKLSEKFFKRFASALDKRAA
jgi:carbon monoxide dehydrogenase subunit G